MSGDNSKNKQWRARTIVKREAATVPLSQQLIVCAVFCALAVAVILQFHRQPDVAAVVRGLPLIYQTLIGVTFGALYWVASLLGARFIARRKSAQHIAQSYSRLDLSGWNPLWIALAAGFGEELFFRGALQPLMGIWLTSILFVLAHIRAYRFKTLDKRVLLQAFSIFSISIFFGFVAHYAGLITAMIVHAAMDVVSLYF
ncbi:MAG: CPBP family intramembrane glutamic endopeptidase, partial [Dokdonella sp.]